MRRWEMGDGGVNDFAILYLGDEQPHVQLLNHRLQAAQFAASCRQTLRPFALLHRVECNGRIIWKVQETHYLAKV